MLTTTYSILVLTGEQKNVRRHLERLEQYLHRYPANEFDGTEEGWLEKAFTGLATLDRQYRDRKIELYLLPAIRRMSGDAQELLVQIDAIRACSIRVLSYICGQMQRAAADMEVDMKTLISTMHLFCKLMHERLDLEDYELLPMARENLTPDEWFDIGAQCLSTTSTKRKGQMPAFSPDIHCKPVQEQRYLH